MCTFLRCTLLFCFGSLAQWAELGDIYTDRIRRQNFHPEVERPPSGGAASGPTQKRIKNNNNNKKPARQCSQASGAGCRQIRTLRQAKQIGFLASRAFYQSPFSPHPALPELFRFSIGVWCVAVSCRFIYLFSCARFLVFWGRFFRMRPTGQDGREGSRLHFVFTLCGGTPRTIHEPSQPMGTFSRSFRSLSEVPERPTKIPE